YQRALAIDPTSVLAHLSLGDLLAQIGDMEGARRQYLRVLELQPDDPDGLNRLGLLMARQGHLQEAIDYFRQALLQAPLSDEVRLNLVQALEGQGRYAESAAELRNHLTQTGSISAQTALAWLLATCPEGSLRRGQEAVTLGEDLCQRTRYQDPVALQVLAAAYAEVGRFDEATRLAGQALALARAGGQEQLATSLAKQLEHHEAKRPFRSSGPPGAGPPPARRLLPPG
ncbi:MAG: tetratricopeptide repeat protein, partial [Planctomycetes bacterium]|nr:tetratricopeptide repeat protein [Planctomycetota bacterium]